MLNSPIENGNWGGTSLRAIRGVLTSAAEVLLAARVRARSGRRHSRRAMAPEVDVAMGLAFFYVTLSLVSSVNRQAK